VAALLVEDAALRFQAAFRSERVEALLDPRRGQ
jgi:hypothetical protein